MPVLSDDLTGSAGVLLTARGFTAGSGTCEQQLDGAGGLRLPAPSNAGAHLYYNTGATAHYSELTLGANWNIGPNTRHGGIRKDPATGDSISWRHNGTNFQIYCTTGGVVVSSSAMSASANDLIRLEVDDAGAVTLKKNGVTICSDNVNIPYFDYGFPTNTYAGPNNQNYTGEPSVQTDDIYRKVEFGSAGGGGSVIIIWGGLIG